ncbi:MAG: hypothetical protein AAB381_00190 [Patescibacteria group bacterium]
METKFQTSFIPKKPVAPTGMAGNVPIIKRPRSSIVMVIATIIFIGSLAAAGGAYSWKYLLVSNQESYKADLEKREANFDLPLITEMKHVNVQINTARQLLNSHLAVSQVFDSVARLTAERVRFLNMELSSGAPGSNSSEVKINMSGSGLDLFTVAFQAKVLSELEKYGLRDVVKNPILTDPTENEKSDVSFRFSASIDPQTLLYSKTIGGAAPSDQPPTP